MLWALKRTVSMMFKLMDKKNRRQKSMQNYPACKEVSMFVKLSHEMWGKNLPGTSNWSIPSPFESIKTPFIQKKLFGRKNYLCLGNNASWRITNHRDWNWHRRLYIPTSIRGQWSNIPCWWSGVSKDYGKLLKRGRLIYIRCSVNRRMELFLFVIWRGRMNGHRILMSKVMVFIAHYSTLSHAWN